MQSTTNPLRNAFHAARTELFNEAAYIWYKAMALLALSKSKTGLLYLRYLILCRLQAQMGSTPLPIFLRPEWPISKTPLALPEGTGEIAAAPQESIEQPVDQPQADLLVEPSKARLEIPAESDDLPVPEEPPVPPQFTKADLKGHSVNHLRRMARKRQLHFDRPISKVRKDTLIAALIAADSAV